MTDSDNLTRPQGFCGRRPSLSTICPGMEIEPPLCGDAIAWNLILLGIDCGLEGPEIARWLVALDGFPMWPPHDALASLMRDAGL